MPSDPGFQRLARERLRMEARRRRVLARLLTHRTRPSSWCGVGMLTVAVGGVIVDIPVILRRAMSRGNGMLLRVVPIVLCMLRV
jgi:hypothetical protein